MNRVAPLFALAYLTGASAAPVATAPHPFSHYQPILDRMPFGVPPPNFDAAPVDPAVAKSEEEAKAEQQKLAKQVNMSAVNVTPEGGTAIGFTDLSAKPPVNYYLLVGASADGWKVAAADYDEETATLEKDGVSITLKLGKGLVESPGPAAAGATAKAPHPGQGLAPGPARGAPPPMPGTPPGAPNAAPPPDAATPIASYKARLLERRQQETKALQDADKKRQEQLASLVRLEAQKEIARREEEAAQTAAAQPEQQPPEQPPAGAATPPGELPPPAGDRPMSQIKEGNVE